MYICPGSLLALLYLRIFSDIQLWCFVYSPTRTSISTGSSLNRKLNPCYETQPVIIRRTSRAAGKFIGFNPINLLMVTTRNKRPLQTMKVSGISGESRKRPKLMIRPNMSETFAFKVVEVVDSSFETYHLTRPEHRIVEYTFDPVIFFQVFQVFFQVQVNLKSEEDMVDQSVILSLV